jgi:hypothetical protein
MGIKRSARHYDAPWLRVAQLFPPYRPHFALEQVILPPYSPLSNWPRKKRGLLFAISDALAYTDSLRNRDEWRSLPRMVAPAIF